MHFTNTGRRGERRAFSLVELAVVLIVVAVITAIAIPTFQATITASDESAGETEVATGVRNAVAIARARGELGVPSPQVVAEAFAEMSAHAPGVSAVTVGAWTVCDVDAVGYNDCVDNATGTLIRYQVAGGVVGIVVEGTYTVLARVEANEVVSWVDADGTPQNALDGPNGPTPTPYTATVWEAPIVTGVTDVSVSITSVTPAATGIDNPVVLFDRLGANKAAFCADIELTEVTGDVFVSNCPGTAASVPVEALEDLRPLFEAAFGLPGLTTSDVRDVLASIDANPDSPAGVACPGAPCSFRVSAGGRSFHLVSGAPNPIGASAEEYSGTYTVRG